jgi:hypothetical protein
MLVTNVSNPQILAYGQKSSIQNKVENANAQSLSENNYLKNKEQNGNPNKRKLTWTKIFVSWAILDVVMDLIFPDKPFELEPKNNKKFNILRPFSSIIKKFKK